MRWIFFSLVFLNIVFAGWQASKWLSSEDLESVISVDEQSVPEIKLLEEGKSLVKIKSKQVKRKPKPKPKPPVQPEEGGETAESAQAESFLEKVQGQELVCEAFGPFPNTLQRSEFVNVLQEKEIVSSTYEERAFKEALFWVVVRSQESLDEVLPLIEKLTAEKIDSTLIEEGELSNGLLLGEFEKEAEASKLVARLMDLGVKANIINKSDSYDVYWVILEKQESLKIDQELLNSLIEAHPYAQRHEKVCKPVAS